MSNNLLNQPDEEMAREKEEFAKVISKTHTLVPNQEKIYRVLAGSMRTTLDIGNIKIPSYVLDIDGVALPVLSGNGLQKALGLPGRDGKELSSLLGRPEIKSIVPESLLNSLNKRLLFKRPGAGGAVPQTYGYEAKTLIQICKVFFDAGKLGLLQPEFNFLAKKSEEYILAFAEEGVESAVFRITGYNELRNQLSLVRLLGEHISPVIQPYVSKFPSWYAEEVYRLKKWDYEPIKLGIIKNTNSQLGTITMDIVYDRLLPGVVDTLKKLNNKRKSPGKSLEHYHHQHLLNKGVDLLKNHFNLLEGLLKTSSSWPEFMTNLDRLRPSQSNLQVALEFEEQYLNSADTKLLQ